MITTTSGPALIEAEELTLQAEEAADGIIYRASGNKVDWVEFSNKEALELFLKARDKFTAAKGDA